MIGNLLVDTNTIITYVLLGVVVLLFVGWFVFSGRKNKQRQKEYVEQLDAIRPGHKVKTAGGICGIVAEVCDDNTVIIETGSEATGKSYVKMDKELIAQTDAKGPTQIAREEAEARRKAEKAAKTAEKPAQTPAPIETADKDAPVEEKATEAEQEAKTEE
ncbi:MAG: preprotein translocase subunit YajC [Clostridia bacterium]|jgi:preprotein translocase YajC subunit|nr:preprotein translocase subunit YajC [Clostridia bacterium]